MATATAYGKIYVDFDTGTNTFFGANVADLLGKIASKPVGSALHSGAGRRRTTRPITC
jgi:uncharacterized membrane-anchored protein